MPISFNRPISIVQPMRDGTHAECASRIRDIDPFRCPAGCTHTEHIHPFLCVFSYRLESGYHIADKRKPLTDTRR